MNIDIIPVLQCISPYRDVYLSLAFPNGYGVSIIRHDGSYGGKQGLFEVAVLRGDSITYDTPVTNDVIGYLDPAGVADVVAAVMAL